MMRTAIRTAGAAALIMTGGCVALEHTNPMDSEAPVTVEITTTRDTLTAYNQSVTFTASAGERFPGATYEWTVGPRPQFRPSADLIVGTGPTFEITWSAFDPKLRNTMTAWVGPHTATKTVVVSQRFGGVEFDICSFICIASIDAGSAPTVFQYTMVDSGGSPLATQHSTTPSATTIANQIIIARTPGVFTFSDASGYFLRIAPNQRGASWVVSTGQPKDSILVYADYSPFAVVLNCPATLAVGEQVQLTATVNGSNGVALIAPVPILWLVTPFGRATVSQSGLLRGISAGTVQVVAREQFSNRQRECEITVT